FEQSDAGRKPRYNKSNQVLQEFQPPTRSNLGRFVKIHSVSELKVARIADLTITCACLGPGGGGGERSIWRLEIRDYWLYDSDRTPLSVKKTRARTCCPSSAIGC